MTRAQHARDKLPDRVKRTLAARDKQFRHAVFEFLEPRHLLSGTDGAEPAVSDGPVPIAMPLTAVAYPASDNPQVAAPTYVTLDRPGTTTPDTSSSPVGLTVPQILSAYNINQVEVDGQQATGAGQTIAIIDAYNDPDIAADLQTFDTAMGLTAAPSFTVVSQTGSTVNLPGNDGTGWAVEESLDVEWAHTIAPGANIMLVEANSNNPGDLNAAVAYAKTQPAVSVISMSYGSSEYVGENNSLFMTPAGHIGITFVASTGDHGAPGEYPADSPNVVAAGGTSLYLTASNAYSSEVGWSGSGGGISQYEQQPNYQLGVVSQSSTRRTIPDVSFDADPNTGPAIIDSYTYGSTDPWSQIGGTSFAAPSWAAMIALADQIRVASGQGTLDGPSQTLPELYQLPAADFHDVTSGNNGNGAAPGYDLVTGIGTPIANLVLPALAAGFTNTPAGLSVTNSAVPSIAAGDDLTYTIRVFNNSATDAQNVLLTDPLPSNETLVTQSQTFGSSFTLTNTGNNVSNTLATLPAGQFAAFTITVTLSSSLASGTQLVNSATARATGSSAEIATSTTGVITQSALQVTNTAPSTVNAGQDLSYAIIVANTGPSDAAAVSLSDLLPSGETLISQTQTSGPAFTLAASGNQLSDSLAALPAGNSAGFTIVVAVSGSLAGNSLLTDTTTASDGEGDQGSGSATTTGETLATGGLLNVLRAFSASSGSVEAGLVLAGSKLYGVTDGGDGVYDDGTIFSVNTDGTGYQVLHSFSGLDGSYPVGSLTLVGSKLYGTTDGGGLDNRGTIFSINTDGSDFQSLHLFSYSDGAGPNAGLTLVGSTLYGTSFSGGTNDDGTLFSINTDGSGFQVLSSFSGADGEFPAANLTLVGSALYGTTDDGGLDGYGTIFAINTDGSDFQTVHSFSNSDGASPAAGLTLAGATLYGTTGFGGAYRDGTVYSIGVGGGGFQTLHSFSGNDGYNPAGSLTLAGSTLYGTTAGGSDGANGGGTVFTISTGGTGFQTLYSFSDSSVSSGHGADSGVTLAGSTLFGTTAGGGNRGGGTVFTVDTDGTGFQTLDSFGASRDGVSPSAELTLVGSMLYGTAAYGGLDGDGMIFSMNVDGSGYQVLYSFSGANGSSPDGSLTVIGTTLYGATSGGGSNGDGTIFSINTDGTDFQTLHSFSFSDGDLPEGGLALNGTTLYGATWEGGQGAYGTIFSINTNGTGFQTLHSFSESDGGAPEGSLTLVGSSLYGTTNGGGLDSDGTIFSISTNGSDFQTLHSFSNSDGAGPIAGLTLVGSTLYGMTEMGSSDGDGTIFAINTDGGDFQTLHSFSNSDGETPVSGLTLVGSVLFGTTQRGGVDGDGTIFSINTDGTGFTSLYSFSSGDGAGYEPNGGLILGGSTFYGTVAYGGFGNGGTIFSLPLAADVAVTNSVAATTVTGADVTYTVTVSSDATQAALNVSLADLLPSGETFVSQAQTAGPSFTLANAGNQISDTIAALPAATSATFTIVAAVEASNGTQLADMAAVAANDDALASDNTAAAISSVTFVYTVDTLHSFTGQARASLPEGLIANGSILYGVTEDGGSNHDGSVYAINADGSGYRVLYSFSGTDGSYPMASLTLVGSTLYGTTEEGGPAWNSAGSNGGYGTIFSINTDGSDFQSLHSFDDTDGDGPEASLTLVGSTFYGTTVSGGASGQGAIFSINTDGTGFQTLYSFSGTGGNQPTASLTLAGSTLYGTTQYGGFHGDGNIFSINTDGTGFQTLYSFWWSTDGNEVSSPVTLAGSTLYGTADFGGTNNDGTIFSINTDGSGFQTLYNFSGSDGSYPNGALTLAGSTLYGTTFDGGANGNGTVFSINTGGTGFQTLHSFDDTDGSGSRSSVAFVGSSLYGTTQYGGPNNDGTIFSINSDGTGFQTLYPFQFDNPDGKYPESGLTLVGSTLYGTTYSGGADGYGTIFSINTDGTGFQTLYSFSGINGGGPAAGLTLVGSTLYGTTAYGGLGWEPTASTYGDGTIFLINPDGSDFQTLYLFSGTSGANPEGGLTVDGSTLIGTTVEGGSAWNPANDDYGDGTIFSISTSGSGFQTLYAFAGTDGKDPVSTLTVAGSTVYGTTKFGGADGYGTIFSVNTDGGQFQTLYAFSGAYDGAWPSGGLLLAGSTLYGTTEFGGADGDGTIFSINTDGNGFQTLHAFSRTDGQEPVASMTLVGSTIYGVTEFGGGPFEGTLFSIGIDGSNFQSLYSFAGSNGSEPVGTLTFAGMALYGTTFSGSTDNDGILFEMPLPTPTDVAVAVSAAGSVLAGQNLTYTVTVTNNSSTDAQNVSLADLLPSGESFASQSETSGPGFTLGVSGNDVTDTIATLPAGASATFSIVASVDANVSSGFLSNTVTVGTSSYEAAISDNSSTATTAVSVAPQVVGAFVSGSAWNASYLSMLSTAGLGNSAVGFELATGANQLATIPWTNVTQISIGFSEFVNVSQDSLTLYNSANTVVPTSGFSYNSTTNVATWQFSTALVANKYVINLAADSVTDANGIELDGAWTTGVSTFAAGSGDGTPGSDFNFYFDVLPGDVNASGTVTNGDVLLTKLQVGAVSNSSNYQLDVNGAANITNSDVLLAKLQVGSNIDTFFTPSLPQQSAPAALPTGVLGVHALPADSLTPDVLTAAAPDSIALPILPDDDGSQVNDYALGTPIASSGGGDAAMPNSAVSTPPPAPAMQPAATVASFSTAVSAASSTSIGLTPALVSPLTYATSKVAVPAIPLTISAAAAPAASPVADRLFQVLADSTTPAMPTLKPSDALALVMGSLGLDSSRMAFIPADDVADDAAPISLPAVVATGPSSTPSPLALDEVFSRNSGVLVEESAALVWKLTAPAVRMPALVDGR
ncbi:MAG TPA: choice-of-anchor tandem repeat GloVer-containing protein [Pirellulales bacterium]|jgi:uncharacterized repeat protein (TIGR01451 family)|nr:choice-of-anchor tandem repeat GloVer-containing protein [Pirellulales bacterium]